MTAVAQSTGRRTTALRLLCLVLPLVAAGYQYAAKSVALSAPATPGVQWLLQVSSDPWTWVMIAFEIVSFVAWMRILASLKLSEAFPLSAISYLLIEALGWFRFHEPITAFELIGSALIVTGVVLIGSEVGADGRADVLLD